jgi:hypothetical protein
VVRTVLVTGDRNWSDTATVMDTLKKLNDAGYHRLIEGEARGADSIARNCAYQLGWEIIKVPADWKQFGRAAGPIRNKQMLDMKPDAVVYFHMNLAQSKGTAHMVSIAVKAGYDVFNGYDLVM